MDSRLSKDMLLHPLPLTRLKSPGMNITFKKAGYQYTGTLINNSYICGSFESMNVWYKGL